jgi:endoglucanase
MTKHFVFKSLVVFAALILVEFPQKTTGSGTVDVWWPTDNASMSGVQPFKALLSGAGLSTYQMFWQVDGGSLNLMSDSYVDYPHKEAMLDLTNWHWDGNGPYHIDFVAKDWSGNNLANWAVPIYIPQAAPAPTSLPTSTPGATSTPAPTPSPTVPTNLYVDPNSEAANQEKLWATSRPLDALQMAKIANQPQAKWFGGWNANVYQDVNNWVSAAKAVGKVALLVAYNIPGRDCGGFSQGGANTPAAYKSWINGFASGIGKRAAIVILEPDALAGMDCLSYTDQQTRLSLLNFAVSALKSQGAKVYLDSGNPTWKPAAVMAQRLAQAGLSSADGFSLDVSNFITSSDNISYGHIISQQTGGKHFVVDTSRNGLGPTPDYQWCNPPGRALGDRPTRSTGDPLVDAYLWIKNPGESDGPCNGGPKAGGWWSDYALGLAQRSAY